MPRDDRRESRDELDDEIRAHLDLRVDDLVQQGVPPAEARRRARIEFGGVEGYKAEMREAGQGWSWRRAAEQIWNDVIVAQRRLRRAPFFMLFAAGSIAVGVAITATMYALLHGVFWAPVAIPDAGTLMVLSVEDSSAARWKNAISATDVELYSAAQQSFARIASAGSMRPLAIGDVQDTVLVTPVSGQYFPALAIKAALGRLIGPADDAADAPAVIVVDDRTWRRSFEADPGVIGRAVRIGEVTGTLIGVTGADFTDLDFGGPTRARAWVATPVARALARHDDPARARPARTVVGRLRPGVTIEQAAAEARAISENLDREQPLPPIAAGRLDSSARRWTIQSFGVLSQPPARATLIASVLVGIAGLVLVVACTNIANLSLARGTMRRNELALRRALGASRARLIRELVVESALVALLGAVLSIVFLRVLFTLVSVELPAVNQNVIALEPKLSLPVLAFCGVAMLLALMVFGVQPALRLTKGLERADLAGGSPTIVRASRGAWWLIRSQVAIAFAFMLLAALAVQFVIGLSRNTSGIDLDRLAVGTVVTLEPRWPEPAARAAIASILERVKTQPGVENAAAATGMPFGMTTTVQAQVKEVGGTGGMQPTALLASTPELFGTLGIAIEKGRPFDSRDTAGSPGVVVLSASTARELFGSTDAVGREVVLETQIVGPESKSIPATAPPTAAVIGIARDTDVQVRLSRNQMLVYVPFTQHFSPGITIAVRTADPVQGVRALRQAVAAVAPELTLQGSGSAEPMLAPVLGLTRVGAGVAIVLGSITLALAMIGLHGILSFLLAGRIREMGLRLALGATSQQLSRLALGQGLAPVLHGLVIGAVLGTLARMAISRMSRGAVATFDPGAMLAVAGLFIGAAWLACARPVRRASRVAPNIVLKQL